MQRLSWKVPVNASIYTIDIVNGQRGRKDILVNGNMKIESFQEDGREKSIRIELSGVNVYVLVKPTQDNIFYSLEVESKGPGDREPRRRPFLAYKNLYRRKFDIWEISLNSAPLRVVYDKDNMRIFVGGTQVSKARKDVHKGIDAEFCYQQEQFRIEIRDTANSLRHIQSNRVYPLLVDEEEGIYSRPISSS